MSQPDQTMPKQAVTMVTPQHGAEGEAEEKAEVEEEEERDEVAAVVA